MRKKSVEERFFYVLSQRDDFRHFCDFVVDPDTPELPDRQIRLFYALLRGRPTDLKKKVLNYCLLLFSSSCVKKSHKDQDLTDPEVFANAQYQPLSVDTMLKCLFSVFSQNGIWYKKDHHFNDTGGFPGYWKDVFAKAQQHRSDFGTRPKASTYDKQYKIKRAAAIKDGRLKPLTNYIHHTWLLLEDFLTHNMLRGSQEPCNITRDDLIHDVMAEGQFEGLPYYRLKSDHAGQKGNALTLRNTTVENQKNVHAYLPMVYDSDDKDLCLYSMLNRHLNEYLPTQFATQHFPTSCL